ncbi:hypothetical protein CXK98_05835 [Stutzerimonas kunmingensis]|uniref:Uncharacterized protein n=1 Tax=Stutzerimonas kunmingensis TaxID=1211807 RepID=A0A9X1SPB5_9GAMM|nr:hypothetical protein [Stutzerimonas kunmingensis]PNG01439.1 hypothetical protein CXK98_05835 [Stutzerimonas kunmingensis]
MPMISYLASTFEKQTITNLVRECFGYDFPDIFRKDQVDYLFNYLRILGAQSVLLEHSYVDKDYLEDFSRYYVKRFGNDGHRCARLHFFSSKVDHRHITSILESGARAGKAISALNNEYLGFVVLKPLPRTFIGKTCLKVMPDERSSEKDKKRLARTYKVDLFGIPLTVNSIAFQEQDKVVAACATTAIWVALHCLTWRQPRSIPSCSEITINAINHIPDSSNSFPSKQLSNKQILRSLDIEGLRYHAESTEAPDRADFLQSVVAHTDSSLPIILSGEVFNDATAKEACVADISQQKMPPGSAVSLDHAAPRRALSSRGGHAICIVGYKIDEEEQVLYVHDDRLGPYARAKLVELADYELLKSMDVRDQKWALGLQKMSECGQYWEEPHELIVPLFAVVPSEKKARLPYVYVHETCRLIEQMLLDELEGQMSDCELKWRTSLREISSIRCEILNHSAARRVNHEGSVGRVTNAQYEQWLADKLALLTGGFARLQWESTLEYQGVPLFTVLFDASEIPQGDAVSAIYVKDITIGNVVLDVFRTKDPDKIEANSGHFLQSFIRHLTAEKSSRLDYLDQTYGTPRAPRNIRESEFPEGKIKLNETLETFYEPKCKTLREKFPRFAKKEVANLIWAITVDGDLLVAEEYDNRGHPSITGFKSARIAGEIRHCHVEGWLSINAESGRYSRDYANPAAFLVNAKARFERYFPGEKFKTAGEKP